MFKNEKEIDDKIKELADDLAKKALDEAILNMRSIMFDGNRPHKKEKICFERFEDGKTMLSMECCRQTAKAMVYAMEEQVSLESIIGFHIAMKVLSEQGLLKYHNHEIDLENAE